MICQNEAMRRGCVALAVVSGWLLAVAPLYAEVMTRNPTLTANWLWAVAGGFIAILAWRWRWWLGAAVSTLALTRAWLMHLEVADPSVGQAIRTEAGPHYAVHFYASVAAAIVLHLLAGYTGFRRRSRRKREFQA
jgi:hypothetical protein